MGPEEALQAALASALTGIGLAVKDFGTQDADGAVLGDFVEIADIVITDASTFETIGHNALARLKVRSDAANAKAIKAVQKQVFDRLNRGALTIEGHRLVLMHREQTYPVQGPKGRLHGVCDYRIIFMEA